MTDKLYPNNEDIILTTKRIAPDKQGMADPNETKSLYNKGNISKRARMDRRIPEIIEKRGSKSVMEDLEHKRFMDKMENSCHRCGKDISSYKAMNPKHYGYGLCKPCNKNLEESVGDRKINLT